MPITVAAIDERLNKHGFIVPGLGDAGTASTRSRRPGDPAPALVTGASSGSAGPMPRASPHAGTRSCSSPAGRTAWTSSRAGPRTHGVEAASVAADLATEEGLAACRDAIDASPPSTS